MAEDRGAGAAAADRATMQRSVLSGGGGSSDSTDVKVVVRVRPQTLDMELQPGVHNCVEIEGYNICTVRSPHESVSMTFNWVAGPATTQNEFFKVVGRPTVENCLSGFNSSIFAYGQTGSGKTFTMIGELPEDGTAGLPTNAGIIPRIFKYLWQRMPEVQAGLLTNPSSSGGGGGGGGGGGSTRSSSSSLVFGDLRRSLHGDEAAAGSSSGARGVEPSLKWLVRCSMLEIHKEDIYDLLRPGSGPLNIREDIRKGVYVEGLCEKVVEDVSDALDVLRAGTDNRQVAATELNTASSRSHCIFTCHIESRLEPQAGMVNVRSSRLHLVDLAGSERLKTSWASALAAAGSTPASLSSSYDGGSMSGGGAGGSSSSNMRLRETTSINSSLTVLGLVILRLTEQQPHIPYRNSKLTFLLQDSIGGNAKTVIVANVSPSEACQQETLSTLGFAARARKIVNKAVVNEDHKDDVNLLRQKVKRLQQELSLARALAAKASSGLRLSDTGLAASAAAQQAADAASQQQLIELQQQLGDALQLLRELGDRNSELEEAVEFWQRERDVLEQNCLEARQELAAMQVSLQQALSENKQSRKHRWFKADKSGKGAQQQQQQQQDKAAQSSPAASPGQLTSDGSASSKAQQPQGGGSGWSFSSMFSKKDKARAAAAAPVAKPESEPGQQALADDNGDQHEEAQQQQQQEHGLYHAQQQQHQDLQRALQLVSSQLQELAASICSATSERVGGCGSDALQMPAGKGVRQLVKLQQQQQDSIPELQGIVSALTSLMDWQQQQQQQQPEPAPSIPGRGTTTGGKMAPSELHRQLIEERTLTSQLQARIRQLQQELLLAGGPAVVSSSTSAASSTVPAAAPAAAATAAATPAPPVSAAAKFASAAARLARLSPGVGVHYSADAACVRALHAPPTQLDAAFSQAAQEDVAGDDDQPGAAEVQEGLVPCDEVAAATAAGAEGAAQPPQPHDGEAVVVQISIAAQDTKEAAPPTSSQRAMTASSCAQPEQQGTPQQDAAAAAEEQQQRLIASLQAEVSELREQLDAVQRERANMHNRLQSARTVLAAARCSTPSSLLSSGLASPSPQPSFSLLTPVFADSIVEGDEYEDDEDDAEGEENEVGEAVEPRAAGPLSEVVLGGSSCSSWQGAPEPPEPGVTSPPCGSSPRRPPSSMGAGASSQHGLPAAPAPAGQGLEEDLSEAEVWRQHHAEVQQYQQHYEHVEQLTKAVHAALTAAETMGYGQWSLPVQPEQEQQQEPLSDAPLPWRGAREGEAGSCDDGSTASETTRSNGSTRGSSLSQAASLMAEPSAASSDTLAPHLITGRHGAAVLSDGAQPATSAAQATPHTGMSLLQQQQQAVQTDEAWPTGPAWEVADYEEEVRQLSDQLQGLVSNNSSLKAVLQQRDAELAAQRERLEQQGHDLACCEDMLQELQERLAASEAAAAASAAEHCDAMWAKGQVQGLMELNEVMQEQLEAQSQELDMRAQELEELRAALQRFTSHSLQASPEPSAHALSSDATAPGVDAATGAAGGSADAAGGHIPAAVKDSPAAAHGPAGADDTTPQEARLDQECKTPRGAATAAQEHASPAQHTSGSKRCRQLQAHRTGAFACGAGAAVLGGSDGQTLSPFKQLRLQTHQLRAEPHNTQVATEQAALLQQQLATVGLHLQKAQLKKQLADIKAQLHVLHGHPQQQQHQESSPSLLRHSPDSLPSHWSPAQGDWEDYPTLYQQQQQQSPARLSLLSRPTQQAASNLGAARPLDGGSYHPEEIGSGTAAAATAVLADASKALNGQGSPEAAAQATPVADQQAAASLGRAAVHGGGDDSGGANRTAGSNNGSSSSVADDTPCSSSSGGSCLAELDVLARDLQALAAASHQASAFKAVSASTLSPLTRYLGPSPERHHDPTAGGAGAAVVLHLSAEGAPAGSAAASQHVSCASSPGHGLGQTITRSPPAAASPGADYSAAISDSSRQALSQGRLQQQPGAALKLQSDLQVSSAYELAAARGLLHAGAVVQEIKSTLRRKPSGRSSHRKRHSAAASRRQCAGHASASAQRSPRSAASVPAVVEEDKVSAQPATQQQQQQPEAPSSPPVVRTLFSSFDASNQGSFEAQGLSYGAAGHAAGGQQENLSILRQLQQQQQYIIQVLGGLSATQQQQQQQEEVPAGGSPAANHLQQLAEAQQQLQVLLHAAGAAIQEGHTMQHQQDTTSMGTSIDLGVEDVGAVPQRSSGSWAALGLDDAAHGQSPPCIGSPTRQRRKQLQDQQQQLQLQGGSPDQHQLRDSSPDKLGRRGHHKAWMLPSLPAPAGAAADQPTAEYPAQQHQQHYSLSLLPAATAATVVQQEHSSDLDVSREVQEHTRLRGQIIRLQLDLQEMKQRVQAAESLVGLTNGSSHTRSTTPDHQMNAVTRWSQESVSTPAAAGTSTAATSSSAGTPTQLVLLSGRNRELQAQCTQRDSHIKLLEGEVRRLQLELKQQALAAAPAFMSCSSSGGGGGVGAAAGARLMTPRNAITAALTPRHHGGLTGAATGSALSIFSPQRRATSSPGSRAFGPTAAFAGATHAAGGGYAGSTHPHLHASRFAGAHVLHGSSSSSAGADPQSALQQHTGPVADAAAAAMPCYNELMLREHPAHMSTLVRASMDTDVSCASSSSAKSRGRGIRVGAAKPPVHVPSLKRLPRSTKIQGGPLGGGVGPKAPHQH